MFVLKVLPVYQNDAFFQSHRLNLVQPDVNVVKVLPDRVVPFHLDEFPLSLFYHLLELLGCGITDATKELRLLNTLNWHWIFR